MAASPEQPPGDVAQLSQSLLQSLLQTTQLANQLPTDEFELLRISSPEFRGNAKAVGQLLMSMAQKIMEADAGPDDEPRSLIADDEEDPEDVLEMLEEQVSDQVADLLEAVDTFSNGRGGASAPQTTASSTTLFTPSGKKVGITRGHNVHRPQLAFSDIDNSANPFVPSITHKPNAKKPLDPIFVSASLPRTTLSSNMEKHLKHNLGLRIDPQIGYPHPYEYELHLLDYPPSQLNRVKETLYRPLSETPCTWVATEAQLRDCLAALQSVPEFAVDLEQHYYRTYLGFVCLMQISTRKEDFLVDTLELRSHMHILNEVFTDPTIVKVFHGANMDIEWLQRDFGLYVVNMFDTGQAARVLEHPKFSLAYLLQHYCNVTAQKQHQLADWRVRPLTEELIEYARSDTHFLLYIYDRMRNELIDRGNERSNLLRAVLDQSRDVCLRKFEKPRVDNLSHLAVYNKFSVRFSPIQLAVLKELFAWRDRIAREEDESTRFVLPNYMMMKMADELPQDAMSLLALCHPKVPPLVRANTQELLKVITDAVSAATENPEVGLEAAGQLTGGTAGEGADTAQAMEVEEAGAGTAPAPHAASSPTGRREGGERAGKTKLGRTASLSPAPSTDQLFAAAGWADHLQAKQKAGETVVKLASENDGYDTSNPLPNSLFPVVDEEVPQDEDTRKMIELVEASLRKSFGVLEAGGAEHAHAAASRQDERSSRSRTSEDARSAQRDGGRNSMEVAEVDGGTGQASDAGVRQGGGAVPEVTVTEDTSAIPKSIAEIYELSNRNRKRNKDKKRKKEEGCAGGDGGGTSDSSAADDSHGEAPRKRKKETSKSMSDTDSFLRTIGWLDGGGKEGAHRRAASTSATADSGGKPKSKKKKGSGKKSESNTYPGTKKKEAKGSSLEQFDYASASKAVSDKSKSKRREKEKSGGGGANDVPRDDGGITHISAPHTARSNARARSRANQKSGTLVKQNNRGRGGGRG